MKRIITAFFVVALGLAAVAQDAPTADQVIDKYLAAIGGKDALAKIEDLSLNITGEMQRNGQPFTIEMESKQKKPNKFMSVGYAFGQEVSRTVCDGTKVSSTRNMMGSQQTNVAEGTDATLQILQQSLFPELLYDTYKIQKTVVGKDTASGKSAWKVEFATAEGKKWLELFDAESGLKLRRIVSMEGRPKRDSPGGGIPNAGGGGAGGQRGGMGGGTANVTFSDYKDVKDGGGVKIPFTRQQGGGQFMMKMTVSSAKANKGAKDSAFEVK